MLFWNTEYVNISQNVLQHSDTSNTELLISKTRNQSIVTFLSLYQFFLKLFSNNLLWWRQVLTNSDFLSSKLGSFNDLAWWLRKHETTAYRSYFLNNGQSAQISQNQDELNMYVIMKKICPLGYLRYLFTRKDTT